MILQEDVAGCLEIRHKGRLMPVAPMQDCLVINIGDVLSAWTGGYFVATPHLVHSPLNSSRVSLPFFFEPDFNAVIKADGTTYARHLEQKCLQNFSY
jgi:isopenicillin N synthase-like dioxygenase